MKPPYPTTRILADLVRVDDDDAVRYVVAELKRARGNVRETARALGCGVRTLYKWLDANPRLAKAFEKHGLGRVGAAAIAAEARKLTNR